MIVLALTRANISDYVSALFEVYILLLILYVLLNMMFSFGLRPPFTRFTDAVLGFLKDVADPYLRLFRRLIPPIGMIDITPMIAIIILIFLRTILVNAIHG